MMRSWIIKLTAASLIACCAKAIAPKGRIAKAVDLACAFGVLLALISPLKELDYSYYAKKAAELRSSGEELFAELEEVDSTLSRSIIQEKCESYIMGVGRDIGADIESAAVTMRWSPDGFWYPVSAEITGERDARVILRIQAELGIAEEDIVWKEADDERR